MPNEYDVATRTVSMGSGVGGRLGALSGCANLQTVGRTTRLSGETTSVKYHEDGSQTVTESSGGVAVHLDAQQRVSCPGAANPTDS